MTHRAKRIHTNNVEPNNDHIYYLEQRDTRYISISIETDPRHTRDMIHFS